MSSVSLPTNAFMGSIDVAHAYTHCELDEEQGYMGQPGLDNEVDKHVDNSTRLEVHGHAFVTNVDGPTQAVASQPDANAARERTHNGINDFVEGVFNAIHRALLWAAESLVETIDAVADMAGYTRAAHAQGASANDEGTEGRADMLQEEAAPVAIATPTARPMTCSCGLPVKIWVVAKQSSNYGRTFVCCPKRHNGPDGSEQCQYFRFADELPVEAATNYPSFRRKQQQRELMFNRKLPDGHANVNSVDQEPEAGDDGGMHFRTAKGGKLEFVQHTTGKVLATICIADEGRSEVQVTLPEEIEGEAHAAIDALATRLPCIRREAKKEHRWRLPVTMTHKDVARVMLATRDVLEGMMFNTDTENLRWLCDSCTDTDLVSRDFATREKLDIDTTVRIRIGTAGGVSFLTDGVATVKLPIVDIKGSKHILEIRAHVADIGKKCLVNTAGLARQGYIFVHGGDDKGADGHRAGARLLDAAAPRARAAHGGRGEQPAAAHALAAPQAAAGRSGAMGGALAG